MQRVLIEDGGGDPSILEGVRRVEGSIHLNRTTLTNLDFMACVEEVTLDVTIFGNGQLTDVDGLWSLTEIGTDFLFSQNDAIEIFDGLPNLGMIPGSLVMPMLCCDSVLAVLACIEEPAEPPDAWPLDCNDMEC